MYVLLIIFFVFSFNNNCANFVWHAFHFPNDLPYRFSFIYSFVVLIVAFKGAMKIKSLRYQDIAIVGMVWMLIIFLYQKNMTSKMSEKTIYISLAFIIVWTGFLLLVKKNKVNTVIVSALVVAITRRHKMTILRIMTSTPNQSIKSSRRIRISTEQS